MKRWGRLAAATTAVVALAVIPASASALTKTVYAGPPQSALPIAEHALGKKFIQRYSPEVNSFFNTRVTINQGDSVSFNIEGFHTVDIPAVGGNDLPLLVRGSTVSGVKDAAGKDFWFDGHEPSIGLNPALFKPKTSATYDGTQRIDTGLPLGSGPPKPLKVTFAKPGVYRYFCDVHPGMIGYVVVKPTGQKIPTAAQDKAAYKKQLNAAIASAKKVAKRKVPKDSVSVGEGDGKGVDFLAMVPAQVKVKQNTTVTFFIGHGSRETHTATFGPRSLLKSLANAFLLKPKQTAQGAFPSSKHQPIPEFPKSHGDGFANVGLIDRDPGTAFVPTSGKIKFLKPGVYHFICLIHTNMRGTIIVTK